MTEGKKERMKKRSEIRGSLRKGGKGRDDRGKEERRG